MKMFKDMDGDGYGGTAYDYIDFDTAAKTIPYTFNNVKYVENSKDCNDDKNPMNPDICPPNKDACLYNEPDSLTLPGDQAKYDMPTCAICQNPSVTAVELCDGIDNNCDGKVDKDVNGVSVAPTCAGLGKECSFFYTCKGTHLLDCNINQDWYGVSFSGNNQGNDKCLNTKPAAPICDLVTGTCVADKACPSCDPIQQKFENCEKSVPCDKTLCEGKGGTCNVNGLCVLKGSSCLEYPKGNIQYPDGKVIYTTLDPKTTSNYDLKSCYQNNNVLFASCLGNDLQLKFVVCANGCENGECKEGKLNIVCPTCPVCPLCSKFIVPDALTPGCGLKKDGLNNDGTHPNCDSFENCRTCEKDCGSCNPSLVDTEPIVVGGPDGVPDVQEYKGLAPKDCTKLSDCDGDGVKDNQDYCPNTDVFDVSINVNEGRINALGCHAADVGDENLQKVRPDGCFTVKDAGFYGGYYSDLLKVNCKNLFGEILKK